jgi:hypothetical protein
MERLVCLILLFCSGCFAPPPLCEGHCSYFDNVYDDKYEVDIRVRDGVRIDAPADYDTARFSELIDAIDACLADIGELTEQEAIDGMCKYQRYEYEPIRRDCFEVKVTSAWHWSQDQRYQLLFQEEADFASCAAKGFVDETAGCFWRATIQDGYRLIGPPEMDLIGLKLLEVETSCMAPYNTPRLVACAAISDGFMPRDPHRGEL